MCRKHGDDSQTLQRIGTSWSISAGSIVESGDTVGTGFSPSPPDHVSGAALENVATNRGLGGPAAPRSASGIHRQLRRLLGHGIRAFGSFLRGTDL